VRLAFFQERGGAFLHIFGAEAFAEGGLFAEETVDGAGRARGGRVVAAGFVATAGVAGGGMAGGGVTAKGSASQSPVSL